MIACVSVLLFVFLGSRSYMYNLDNIQLFVYLFAPLISSLRESEFQTLKLENGLRLWQQLWEYRSPDVPCFATPVKPKRNVLKANRNLLRVNFNAANIYIGKGTSTDNIYLGFEDPCQPGSRTSRTSIADSANAPLARLSDICALSTTTDASTFVEIICEVCNQAVQARRGELSCQCGRRDSFASFMANKSPSVPKTAGSVSPVDKDYVNSRLESASRTGPPGPTSQDVLSATYFDVAVLRCLFCPQWAEEGVYWSLRYVHQRLLEICDERQRVECTRERSKSLPAPHMQVSPGHTQPPSPPTPSSPKEYDQNLNRPDSEMFRDQSETRREPAFKKIKVGSELKQIFDSKVKPLLRRESGDQLDLTDPHSKNDSGRASPEHPNHLTPLEQHVRNTSPLLEKLSENDEEDSLDGDRDSYPSDSGSDFGRRKSVPNIHQSNHYPGGDDEEDDDSSSGKQPLLNKDEEKNGGLRPMDQLQKPVITITEDSPDPTPSPSWGMSKRESMVSSQSFRSYTSHQKQGGLQRSQTDSNINYKEEEDVEEVPGSVFYIQNDGQINFQVILQGIHSVSSRKCTPRVCGVILNILNCLLDLDIIEKKDAKPSERDAAIKELSAKHKKGKNKDKENKTEEKKKEKEGEKENGKKEKPSSHSVAMETTVR